MRHFRNLLLVVISCLLLPACQRQLPLPTPGQQNLVVLAVPGPLTLIEDGNGGWTGLEHDLVQELAAELGVGLNIESTKPGDVERLLAEGKAHLAIGWFSPKPDGSLLSTAPITHSRDMIFQHDSLLPLSTLNQLQGKTVHVIAGSRQAANLSSLRTSITALTAVEHNSDDVLSLLEALDNRRIDYALLDDNLRDLALHYAPNLESGLSLGEKAPIVWLTATEANPVLVDKIGQFLTRVKTDGTFARIYDRHVGHARRLDAADVSSFLADTETILPKLRPLFQNAQVLSGIDWRLLAAIAYQESHWNANATSPTNVRGIMMLTEDTADRLGVTNRLDPRESILAGARYLNLLKELQAPEVAEPDRTWLALSAYNIGPGHFSAARNLAKQLGADPAVWFEMKQILPLLAQPKYYEKLKSGRARGGEAVVLVENIRAFYDLLLRHEQSYHPLNVTPHHGGLKPGAGTGLKPIASKQP